MIKRALLLPLRFKPVRSRLAFWLNQEHYRELGVEVPLSHGLVCPIHSPEYWCSFSEVFINAEYSAAFDRIPLPNRWIDLGCHAGFFSLYLEWLRRKAGASTRASALLADADRRVEQAIRRLNEANGLSLHFVHAGIGDGGETMKFTERAFMASSASGLPSPKGGTVSIVPRLTCEMISATLPAPYDLIKVDIEGSEHDLLKHYGSLLKECRHLLLEWHSWHSGGGGKAQLIELAQSLGMELQAEIRPDHEVAEGQRCGVLLFENSALAARRIAV